MNQSMASHIQAFAPGISKDAAIWTRACVACQRSKIHASHHVQAPLHDFKPPQKRFQHIHLDIVGPLPPSQGYTHLLTIVDRFTRWPEAIPLSNTSTITIARALLHGWVSRFGTPSRITSDRGSQFTSQIWHQVATFLGTELHHTTSYQPQANGMVERFQRDLKAALKAGLPDALPWMNQLPRVLLGL